jgi:hypothetical protein
MTAQPSPRQVLLDLADRCEREEPSRDLDLAILNAIHAPSPEWVWRSGDETITRLVYGEGAPGNPVCSLDAYTTSLDAAVTLVPHHDGRRWFWRAGESSLYRGWAHLNRVHPDNCDRKDEASANAATPALALCAASLRARAEAA